MTLQEYIGNKALEKTTIETLKTMIINDVSISFEAKQIWLNQIEQYSNIKDVIDLLAILFPRR